jgi:hypothetical protein
MTQIILFENMQICVNQGKFFLIILTSMTNLYPFLNKFVVDCNKDVFFLIACQ